MAARAAATPAPSPTSQPSRRHCRLATADSELTAGDDFYATASGRANITMLVAVELDGVALNSNDVNLECTDDNTSVLVGATMSAIKVGSITTAYPANLPVGTSMTSPGRSASKESVIASRRSARRARLRGG